jgi:hypothetical protein
MVIFISQVGSLKGGASQLSLDFDSGIENMEVGIGRSQCVDSEINSIRIQHFVETGSGPESGLDPYPSPVFFTKNWVEKILKNGFILPSAFGFGFRTLFHRPS